MTIDMRTRVALVDDHPLVRMGLSQLIASDPSFIICGQAATTVEARSLIATSDPDVAIFDLMLKESSGLDLIKEMRKAFPHLKILVLSMHDQRVYAERCLKAGASGYLMKEEAASLVILALKRILAGEVFLSDSLGSDGKLPRLPVETLSDRELQVFELIGNGLPTRTIAERLELSDKTIETHKANIKLKLKITDGAQLIRLAIAWNASGS